MKNEFAFKRTDFIEELLAYEAVQEIESALSSVDEHTELYERGSDDGLLTAIRMIESEFGELDGELSIEKQEVVDFLTSLLPPATEE